MIAKFKVNRICNIIIFISCKNIINFIKKSWKMSAHSLKKKDFKR